MRAPFARAIASRAAAGLPPEDLRCCFCCRTSKRQAREEDRAGRGSAGTSCPTMYPTPARTTRWLRRENQLPGGLAAFEIAVRALGVGQFVFAAMADLELLVLDHVEHLTGTPEKLLARARIVHDRRPRNVERAFRCELRQVERRYGAARGSEEHHVSARSETVQALLERRLADAVVHDRDARVVRDAFDFSFEVM